MKHVVSFSGGKDSTAMLLMMIEKGMQIDNIICVDTTKEFPQMYEHIEKVKAYIAPLKIETVKIDFDYWLGKHIKTKGKNKGKVGYGFPDFRNRWCTSLKTLAFSSIVYSNQVYNPHSRCAGKRINKDTIEYHGIAFDEPHRTNNNNDRNIEYPLVDLKMTEKQALQYCYDKGFDWGGLYENMTRVSCWCCPMSRIGELKILYNDFPQLWQQLKEMDKLSYRCFRSDYTVDELESKFKKENIQSKLNI